MAINLFKDRSYSMINVSFVFYKNIFKEAAIGNEKKKKTTLYKNTAKLLCCT